MSAWARERLFEQDAGPAGLLQRIKAIGRFYDFYVVEKGCPTTSVAGFRRLIAQFYAARRYGCASLLWRPVRRETAARDVQVVSGFSNWCADNFAHVSINPIERTLFKNLTQREKRTHLARQKHLDESDKLVQLKPSTNAGRGIVNQALFKPPQGRKPRDVKAFPAEYIEAFLAALPSIRDKLYFMLLFFGGLRISEPAHLFCTDIRIETDGSAKVILGHPQDGAYEWYDHRNRKRYGTRTIFLRERYGLGPRSKLGAKNPLFSGWKGRMCTDGKRAESELFWIRHDASLIFARLHAQYMRQVRSLVDDRHPYYFVDQYGRPCTLKQMHSAFVKNVERIGLSMSQPGVNAHGPRHHYGSYCASVLRLTIEVTQKLMGHTNISSTRDYYTLSISVAHRELAAAIAQVAANSPPLLIQYQAR